MQKEALDLKAIVEAGTMAPSGDNLQPWKFFADHTGVDVYVDPAATHDIYDFRRRGSLASVGAAVENIVVAAEHFGRAVEVKLFPSRDNPDLVARINFTGAPMPPADEKDLYLEIRRRAVNRNLYKNIPLTPEQKETFTSLPHAMRVSGSVRFVEASEKRRALARVLNNSDRLLFLNRPLHDGLFKYFRWTPKEIEEKRDGLDVKTLGLAKADQGMLRLLQSWPLTQLFGFFGAADIVAKKTEQQYSTGSAIIAIVRENDSEEDFLTGGRMSERLWLMADRMGLSVHPSFGFVILGQRVTANEVSMFTPKQIKMIAGSYDTIKEAFSVREHETIVMLFRIGVPEHPPSARAIRKYPEDTITYKT